MEVISKIAEDLIQSLKNKDELTTLVLRQLKASITNAEIANNRKDLSEEQIIKLFRSEIKKRKEASGLYVQGGREELAAKENAEIGIIKKYLPAEMSEDQIKAKVTEVVEKLGASGMQDMGKVIGAVVKELGGTADGSVVSKLVKKQLS